MSRASTVRKADSSGIEAEGGVPPGDGDASSLDARQFVIFHVQDEMFAIPLGEVQEIIRMPALVRMPLSPPALEGLANLRGSMLPVINLRTVFGFAPLAHDDATRVVVLDHGRPIGLVVDRMANVVTADADSIESTDSIEATVDTALLTGMIKGKDGVGMVMILDAGQLVNREFNDLATRAGTISSTGGSGPPVALVAEAVIDETQLVSFEVAGQEYAFPIEEVQEIVQLPETITEVPNSPSHVLGVITLRNRLLPLISLRNMFGLPAAAVSDANKVVVVSLGADISVGLVMDCIREVLRVRSTVIDPVPALLAHGRAQDDIRAICRLDDGKRLVSILSAAEMFNASELRGLAAGAGQGGEAMADGQTGAAQDATSDDEEQFVVFRLMDEEYGVPIAAVQEIVRVPDILTRVPKTPIFIEGVINLRGSVLPVVDQRLRFGLAALERNDQQRIMVFTVKGVRTGFIVDQVSEVMRINSRFIGDAPKLSAEQQKLIRRVANLEAKKRMILLLDIDQLLNVKELGAIKSGAA